MTIHGFDMARYLLDEEIETVVANASVLVVPAIGDMGDYDCANVILATASEKQCTISNSRRTTYGYDQRIEVLGSTGMVSTENQRKASIEIATAQGFTKPPLYDFFITRYTAAYTDEIEAFIRSLSDRSSATPGGQDGWIAIAQAALQSVEQGRMVRVSEVM